jgi:exoribonuclease R
VNVPAFSKPVLLLGREHMNRAVHGDVVVVEVFSESEWKAPADEVVDQDGTATPFTSKCRFTYFVVQRRLKTTTRKTQKKTMGAKI